MPTASRRVTFCPSNDRVPGPLLSCHHTAWSTNLGVVWRDGKPDCGVDLAPDHRGFPMGPRAAIPHSGSGHLVRASLRAASAPGVPGPASDSDQIGEMPRMTLSADIVAKRFFASRRATLIQ